MVHQAFLPFLPGWYGKGAQDVMQRAEKKCTEIDHLCQTSAQNVSTLAGWFSQTLVPTFDQAGNEEPVC